MIFTNCPKIRLRAFGLATVMAAALGVFAAPALASDKKGVSVYNLDRGDRVEALNVSWYYTWSPNPSPSVRHPEFVPMVLGGWRWKSDLPAIQAREQKTGQMPVLLVDNEPDHADQDNITVDTAVSRWPLFPPLARSLSTPAAADPLGPWFAQFMKSAARNHLQTDFIAVHFYTPPDVDFFLHKLDAVYARYHKPIWITEFGVADWDAHPKTCKPSCTNRYTDAQVQAFMAKLLPELEKRDFVVRYAWYTAGLVEAQGPLWSSRLFDPDGKPTPLGCFYRNFNWPSNPAGTGSCQGVQVKP